jgi:hypothetical protein
MQLEWLDGASDCSGSQPKYAKAKRDAVKPKSEIVR